jgi:hypothetical protein
VLKRYVRGTEGRVADLDRNSKRFRGALQLPYKHFKKRISHTENNLTHERQSEDIRAKGMQNYQLNLQQSEP